MAKAKKAKAEAVKTVEELGNGWVLITFPDGTTMVAQKVVDVPEEVLAHLVDSDEDDSGDDDEEEDEDDDSDDEEDDDSDEDDSDDEEEEEEEDDSDDEEEDVTAEDLMEMDFDELEDLVDNIELDIDVDEFEDDENGLRKAVAKALDIKLPKAKKTKKKKK